MEKVNIKRVRATYASVVISISLVLFLIGLIGVLALNAKKVGDNVRENFAFTIFLKDSAKKVDVTKLQKTLEMADYVKSTEYVSKEEAAVKLKEQLGEDFVDFLGYNPIKNSIDIRLKAEYVNPEKMTEIEKNFTSMSFVEELIYDKFLVEQMSKNIEEISLWLTLFAAMFLLVSVGLINSSIRLSVYSKRFLIKTMQLVGATKGFIRRPFLFQNIKLGLLGAVLALILLSFMLYYLQQNFPIISSFEDIVLYLYIYLFVITLGVVISWLSTYFAMNKYLSLKTTDLYY